MASNPPMIYLNHAWIHAHLKQKNLKSQKLDIEMDSDQARTLRDIKPEITPDQETGDQLEDKTNRVGILEIEPDRDQEIASIFHTRR